MIKEYQQIDWCGKKIFEKATLQPPFRFFNQMPNEACFYYLKAGEGTKVIGPGKTVSLKSKEGVVMQCGNYLWEMLATEGEQYAHAVAVHFHPDILKMIYDKEFPDFLSDVSRVQPLALEKYNASELLQNYIQSLEFYFENESLITDELIKIKLKELILLLARTDNADMIRKLISGMFSRVEIAFKEIIEANLYNGLSIDEWAQLTNLSVSSFKREFQKHYSSSPARYVKGRKLEKAAKLLAGTNLRVTTIAYDLGFSDLAHFSRSFQKEYKISPSEYRLNFSGKSLG